MADILKANKHKFDPEEVEAKVGDTLRFVMYPPMHSVVRAEYEHPCQPLHYANRDYTAADGWWSGFFEVPDDAQVRLIPSSLTQVVRELILLIDQRAADLGEENKQH